MRVIQYRRKREGKTNYGKRLELLVSRKPRAVIRKSLHNIQIQVVKYTPDGDLVVASAHSRDLVELGLKHVNANIMTAYLTGLLAGKRAVAAGITEAVSDLGLQKAHPKGKLFAAVKGLIDAGVAVPCSEEALPDMKRITGEHIAANTAAYTGYKKAGITVTQLPTLFEQVKQKIVK